MNYLRKIVYESTWNGDPVRAEMEPLDRESFIRLWSLRKNGGGDSVENYRAAIEVMDKHLVVLTGLVDAACVPIEKETVLGKIFFASLVNDLFEALMSGSTLGKATSSGSAARSPAGTEERSSSTSQ